MKKKNNFFYVFSLNFKQKEKPKMRILQMLNRDDPIDVYVPLLDILINLFAVQKCYKFEPFRMFSQFGIFVLFSFFFLR